VIVVYRGFEAGSEITVDYSKSLLEKVEEELSSWRLHCFKCANVEIGRRFPHQGDRGRETPRKVVFE